jgi:hypothetical protein
MDWLKKKMKKITRKPVYVKPVYAPKGGAYIYRFILPIFYTGFRQVVYRLQVLGNKTDLWRSLFRAVNALETIGARVNIRKTGFNQMINFMVYLTSVIATKKQVKL